MKTRFCIPAVITILSVIFCLILTSQIHAQDDGENQQIQSRDIVPSFETSRPTAKITEDISAGADKYVFKKPTKSSPKYKRISQQINSGKVRREDKPKRFQKNNSVAVNNQNSSVINRQKISTKQKQNLNDLPVERSQQIGVTLWHLLPTNQKNTTADGEVLPVSETNVTRYLFPKRVSLDTLFQTGDYVRLSLEASQRGYIYVVDQEMYGDGTLGDAFLVFPNKRIRNGSNLVSAGKPIELPDLKGNPFYFELRPQSSNGKPIISEVLSVIITDKPILGLNIGEQPILITPAKLADWRSKYAGQAEIFERETATTEGYTRAERDAANNEKALTGSDPLPNTVFLVENKRAGGVLITVPIWYGSD